MRKKEQSSPLSQLEAAKRWFGEPDLIASAIRRAARTAIRTADDVVRLHESLLFFRAYPPNAQASRHIENGLTNIASRVVQLLDADIDLSPLDDPEVSGIAGTSVTSNFSYALVRWLVRKYPRQVAIDWDWFEEEDRFGAVMPQFLPLLAEDAMVEAHVPYREWLRAAKGRHQELTWLIEQFESLEVSDRAKGELYDSLRLHVTWRFGSRSSRTGMKLLSRKIFYHAQPLIQRRDVSLVQELNSPPLPVRKLSRAEGKEIIDLARATSAVRYRELHGFTCGDVTRVLRAELGRGTVAFVTSVPPQNRLPLRAYHAALILKNGVPVAYFEGLSIFERMESGFNLYYTFRDGETAWLYARILRLMRQLLGVTVFSIDPYQVGNENEEGIESGAFWFYRKLGFRPVRSDLTKLTLAEERKLATGKDYRTSPRTLRKLAAGHLLFDLKSSAGKPARSNSSDWDSFTVRNLGLAVQRWMAKKFDSDPERLYRGATRAVSRALGLNTETWSGNERSAFRNFSVLLAQIPRLDTWTPQDKQLATQIIRAKAGPDETRYLRLLQKHKPLRDGFIEIGSGTARSARNRARD